MLEYVGNIEWPGFSRKIIKRHFWLPLSLSRLHTWQSKNEWGRKSAPYMRVEQSRLLSWGSFLLLLLVLDLCYALGEGGVTTITDGRKCQRGISEGESPPCMRGRRIPTVVVGVASPSVPCARHFGVMHSGNERRSYHHQRSNVYTTRAESFQEKDSTDR